MGRKNLWKALRKSRSELMHELYGTQTPSFSQQLDSVLVASMQAAFKHAERLKTVTFERVKEATDRDPS